MYRNCINKDKASNFSTIQGQIEAFFIHKLSLSRNKSSPKQQTRPCFRRVTILVHEVYQYLDKKSTKLEKIGKFSKSCFFSTSIPNSFRLKNCVYLFSKLTGQHTLSLLTRFNVPIDEVCQKVWKKCMKPLKKIFWDFCHFRCQFETFSFRKMQRTLRNRLLANQPFPFWLSKSFQFTRFSKIDKKCEKKL